MTANNGTADDAREVEHLLYRYAECIDAGDFAGVGELFARGRIVVDPTNPATDVVGAAAVTALYEATTRRYPDDGTPHTHHVTTNAVVEVDGHTATSRSYFTVFQALPELALAPIVTGRYHDRFAHTDGQWHFVERRMELRHIGDVSQHLLIELPR